MTERIHPLKYFDNGNVTRNLFFTGKGGVGKTSLAAAVAVQLADRNKQVLLVSTDPASNLDEVLDTVVGHQPTPISHVPRLFALNLDPEQSAHAYRERVIGPYRGVLPETVVARMAEQLSGSCTVEIAAFDEFTRLLADPEATHSFDHVVFDTAPTGHTLRLLSLPAAWNSFLDSNRSGTSCLGPLSGLNEQRALYRHTVDMLSDPARTTLILVARADRSSLAEAERTSSELATLGVGNQQLVVNAVFQARDRGDEVARALQQRDEEALADMPPTLASLPKTELPWSSLNLIGVAALRQMLQGPGQAMRSGAMEIPAADVSLPYLRQIIDEIAANKRGVVLTMGKGGVGKTTVAAAVAVELARRGHEVHLTTTDPAANVEQTLSSSPPRLSVSRIDPRIETQAYRAEVLATAGSGLDSAGRALLEEDLRSPCTEEVAVFRAFARMVDQGQDGFVVLDTAPTGHTILLLDAALAYHRELSRQAKGVEPYGQQLLPRLRDPEFTKILVVTLPQATPVHEAAKLEQDLHRAQISTFAWVVNQCLAPLSVRDPALVARQQSESRYLNEVVGEPSRRVAVIPWLTQPPVGVEGLLGALGPRRPRSGAGAAAQTRHGSSR